MDPVSQNPIPEPLDEQQLSEQENIRREKLNKLMEAGQSPYAVTHFNVSKTSREILSDFDALEGQFASLAGRLMSKRVMGKASFANILDTDGQLQILCPARRYRRR